MRYENQKQELLRSLLFVDVQGGGGWHRLALLPLVVIVVTAETVCVTRPKKSTFLAYSNFSEW